MKAPQKPRRQGDRPFSFARTASLSVALCALLLTGCTVAGPQGNGDLAGRQSKATVPPDAATVTVLTLAERSRAAGDLPSAISFYRRAINLDPNLPKAYVGLGETLLAAGVANEAVDAFRSAHDMWPNDPAILRGLGSALVAVNQPQSAIEVLNQSIKFEPTARAYSMLGVAQDLVGDKDAADQAFRQGLVLAPDDLDLLNNFGLSLALRGDYDAAIRTLRRVASDGKATARHRLNLALVLGLAGRDDDAAQIARIDLDERSVHSNLTYYTLLRGLSPEARAAAILRPGTPLPNNAIATATCNGQPCAKPVMADDTPKAAPTTKVQATPIAPKAAAKTAAVPTASGAKPAPKAKDAQPKPDFSKNSQAVAPTPAPTPENEPQAPQVTGEAKPAPTPAAPPAAASSEPTEPANGAPQPLTKADDAAPAAQSPALQSDAAKPADIAQDPKPAAAEKAEPAKSADATPPAPASNAEPTVVAEAPAPVVSADPAPKAEDASATKPADLAPVAVPPPSSAPVVKASAATTATAPDKQHEAWLQIASFRSEQNAQSARRNMTNADPEFEKLFAIRRVDLGPGKGIFFVLRMGPFESTDRAHDFCGALRDRKIECFVSR